MKLRLIISFHILFLGLFAFNISDNSIGQWDYQPISVLNGREFSGIDFVDSLNGYATASTSFDPNYILKTTNSGNTWFVVDSLVSRLTQIKFINESIGFACGARLYKTTDKGYHWNQVIGVSAQQISILNEDTIFAAYDDVFDGGVLRTTNGGNNWTRVFFQFSDNPDKIYMYNWNLGFISDGSYFKRTTDGGNSWHDAGEGNFTDIYFINSLTGWRANYQTYIQKTTDGGISWIKYPFPPPGGIVIASGCERFKVLSEDTIWSVGSQAFYGSGRVRGLINITTNGGLTWGYQQPDTSIEVGAYKFIDFINNKTGWAYSVLYGGVNTTTGGLDTTIYVGINDLSSNLPEHFILYQNYPNPFNPITHIKYELKKSYHVQLKIFDLAGKEILTLLNKQQVIGVYDVEYNTTSNSSGIYICSIFLNGKLSDSKKMILVK